MSIAKAKLNCFEWVNKLALSLYLANDKTLKMSPLLQSTAKINRVKIIVVTMRFC